MSKNQTKEREKIMFERIDYIVGRIDGDYAYLNQLANPDAEEKCVARALLPDSINVGTKLAYSTYGFYCVPFHPYWQNRNLRILRHRAVSSV